MYNVGLLVLVKSGTEYVFNPGAGLWPDIIRVMLNNFVLIYGDLISGMMIVRQNRLWWHLCLSCLFVWIADDVIWIVFQSGEKCMQTQFEMQCINHESGMRWWNSDWNSRHSFCYNPFLQHDSSVSPAKLQEDNVIPRIPLCLHLLMLGPPVFSVCFWLTMICKALGICKARTLDYSERRMEGRKQGKGRPNWYLEKVKNIPEAPLLKSPLGIPFLPDHYVMQKRNRCISLA